MKPNRPDSHTAGSFLSLARETKPPVLPLVIAIVLSLASTLGGLVVPLGTKQIIDGFAMANLDPLKVAFIGGAFLLQALSGALAGFLLARIGQHVVARLRDRLWRKQLSVGVGYFDANESGALTSRVTNDTTVIKSFITDNVASFATGIITVVGAAILLFVLNWHMALVILSAAPITMLIMGPIGRFMRRLARKTVDEQAKLSGVLARVLSEIRLVKASNAEATEYRKGREAIDQLQAYGVKEARVQSILGPVMGLLFMSMLVVVIGYGGYLVSTKELSAGDLVAFILYLVQIIFPITQIAQFFTALQKARGATESLMTVLNQTDEVNTGELAFQGLTEPLRFDDVGFAYQADNPVLGGLSFELEPGTVTAFVGPSGGGKTTIFSLLERFYQPTSGHILHGQTPIGHYELASWRRQIGYVSQDSPLMNGTIFENIAYGQLDSATEEAVRTAARLAYADGFIDELPDGYQTNVGERGVKLSGGQRQRIAIARALLRNPSLLLLDEATSSLDSVSEEWVQKALQNLMRGRTTVVIAHRLATVIHADQILFVEKGRLTGRGRHSELLVNHELYRSFAERQLVSGVEV